MMPYHHMAAVGVNGLTSINIALLFQKKFTETYIILKLQEIDNLMSPTAKS